MPNPVKRGRPTVEDVLQVGRSTVGDVLQIGRNTVEEVLHVGRSTVEEVIQVGRNTVESARQLRQGTMQAAVLHGRQDIRIEDVPVPRAGHGELIVRVGAALTCGTDLKVFRRGYHARMIVPPALFGHELAGTVVEAGEGVEGFANGCRVVALNSAPCGQCYFCRAVRRTYATTCSSITAPTLSSFVSLHASSPRTRLLFPTMFRWSTPRSQNPSPAPSMDFLIPTRIPKTPSR